MPTLAHKIRLDPTPDQIRFFKQAASTARFVTLNASITSKFPTEIAASVTDDAHAIGPGS